MKVTDILQEVGAKVGIPCALLLGYLYMQNTELNTRIEKLESKIETVNEIKQDLSSIKTQLDFIIKYKLEEKEAVNVKRK